jgi:hypothetical protein
MGSIYAEDVIKIALNEVGYKEGPRENQNKYAAELDKVDYFVGCGHKNFLPWCCVFTNWCLFKASDSSSASGKKWDAINFQYESSTCNTSAVVKYYKGFFKRKGKIYSSPKPGDIAFYGDSHVGLVISVSGSSMVVVEGNTGNMVKKKTRPISDSGCFGRPSYDKKPSPTPPSPTPDKKPYPGEWPKRPSRGYFQRYDKGPEVVKLQKLLLWTKPGCLPRYGADGEIGSETLQAVFDCQGIWGAKQDKFYGSESESKARQYKK